MLCRLLLTLVVSALLSPEKAPAVALQVYYRIADSSNSVILDLTENGILSWSNAATSGQYLIERTTNFIDGPWTPVTRGGIFQGAAATKVHDFEAPTNMVFIPGGTYLRGDSQNDPLVKDLALPVHTVTVSPFYLDKYEFTNLRLREVLNWALGQGLISVNNNTVSSTEIMVETNLVTVFGRIDSEILFANNTFTVKPGRDNYPAEFISWYGAVAICNYLSGMSGRPLVYNLTNLTCDFSKKGFRLPTEGEWEWAARGGYQALRFPWSETNIISHSYANYLSANNNTYDIGPYGFHPLYANHDPKSSPVGSFAPNNFGLYDVAGNAWEWTWDWHFRYSAAAQVNPTGPATGINRIIRGGSWFTKAERLTCAMRYPMTPDKVFDDIGFRVLLPY